MKYDMQLISREELKQKLERGDRFQLVMALGDWEYRAKHIPGSLHFPTRQEALAELSQDDEIVVYCSSYECIASVLAYKYLVHGEDSNVCICRGSQQDTLGIGEEVHGLLQKLDARHLLYVLGNEQEGHRFIAQLELFQRGKRLTPGCRTHNAKVSTIRAQ